MTPRRGAVPLAAAALSLLALAACESVDSPDVAATWEEGYLHASYIGGNGSCAVPMDSPRLRECMDKLSETARREGRKFPVLVFAHGCGGPQRVFGEWFNMMGYVAVSPDSFARQGRRAMCPSGYNFIGMRTNELTHARERLKAFDWVDQDRVFVTGFSEGGLAAAEHPGKDFRAKIVMGYGCALGGLKGPADMPVLNLVGEQDQDTSAGARLCVVKGRPRSQAVHVPGRNHFIQLDPFAEEKIKAFLAAFE